jgi:hypothetical protein
MFIWCLNLGYKSTDLWFRPVAIRSLSDPLALVGRLLLCFYLGRTEDLVVAQARRREVKCMADDFRSQAISVLSRCQDRRGVIN